MSERSVFELGVRQHLNVCREETPIPSRDSLRPRGEAQCRVLGGHLINWLSDWGPQLLQERAALSASQKWDVDPLICFRSNMPGLVAAQEIFQGNAESVVWGLSSDFESLPAKDDGFVHHVELRSVLSIVAPEALDHKLRQRHPISDSEDYFLHRDESVLGRLFARGGDHLWKWNGQQLILLEEAFETWVS